MIVAGLILDKCGLNACKLMVKFCEKLTTPEVDRKLSPSMRIYNMTTHTAQKILGLSSLPTA